MRSKPGKGKRVTIYALGPHKGDSAEGRIGPGGRTGNFFSPDAEDYADGVMPVCVKFEVGFDKREVATILRDLAEVLESE